jgi:signal transduction histidine kinase
MTVRLRFTLLLGLLLLSFAGTLLALQWLENREKATNAALLHRNREQQLDHWLAATGRALRSFAREGALAAAAQLRTDPALTALAETGAPIDQEVNAYWLVRRNGTMVQHDTSHGLAQPPVPAAQIELWTADSPPYRFFSESDTGLIEICVEPVVPHKGVPPWGWLLATRHWNENRLKILANLTEGRVTLDLHPALTSPSPFVHTRLLPDWRGRPLRSLQVSYPPPDEIAPEIFGAPTTLAFFGFGLLLIAALALSLWRWVLQPLELIGAGLKQGDAAPLAHLLAGGDEFAGVARLLNAAFTQRNALEKEIEERRRIATALLAAESDLRHALAERTRLGRDLHDGVIQTLYAMGMGLSSVQALLQPGQEEAADRLNQGRAALNEVIHDVRNFITGLEPETLREQTFAHAVSSLLDCMKSISPVTTECTIDEALATQLTLNQRANALHIMREAVSNALRHGAAKHIQVTLSRTPEGGAALDIRDDGLGFDPGASTSNHGRGLENFTRRAEDLDATFTLHAAPGRGTHLRFVFTLPQPT